MGHFIEELLREAIYTEKKSRDFCRLAAVMVSDRKTREVFAQLADEEFEHARYFFVLYTGSEFASTEILNRHHRIDDPMFEKLLKEEDEKKDQLALELALDGEKVCIDRYSTLVRTIREPKYRDAFADALHRSRIQYQAIEKEYLRVLGSTPVVR